MARSIFAILYELQARLDELRDALAPLATLSGDDAPPRAAARTAKPAGDDAPKRRGRPPRSASAPARPRKASADVSSARALQGRYMGTIRGLSKAQQEQVRGVRAERGIEAAIELAKRLAAE